MSVESQSRRARGAPNWSRCRIVDSIARKNYQKSWRNTRRDSWWQIHRLPGESSFLPFFSSSKLQFAFIKLSLSIELPNLHHFSRDEQALQNFFSPELAAGGSIRVGTRCTEEAQVRQSSTNPRYLTRITWRNILEKWRNNGQSHETVWENENAWLLTSKIPAKTESSTCIFVFYCIVECYSKSYQGIEHLLLVISLSAIAKVVAIFVL